MKEHYSVSTAYLFIGYIEGNNDGCEVIVGINVGFIVGILLGEYVGIYVGLIIGKLVGNTDFDTEEQPMLINWLVYLDCIIDDKNITVILLLHVW